MLPMELDPDDDLILRVQTSVDNADVSGRARVFRHGRVDFVPLQFPSPTSDRAQYNTSIGLGGGTLLGARISTALATAKRGQIYAQLEVRNRRRTDVSEVMLCKGYVYAGNSVGDGEFIESGPGGGEGFLSWVSLAADIAPVDLTRVLAATNAIRKIHGFAWFYNASAAVASRTQGVVALRKQGLAFPTGFAGAANQWTTGNQVLTASEEGVIYAMGNYWSKNDNGTLTSANTSTEWSPLPIMVTEDDLAELNFDVDAAETDDRHSIYLLQEEWLVI